MNYFRGAHTHKILTSLREHALNLDSIDGTGTCFRLFKVDKLLTEMMA